MINNNTNIQNMKKTLSDLDIKMGNLLEKGNNDKIIETINGYKDIREHLSGSDGFVRWKHDSYQAYWETIRNSLNNVSELSENSVGNNRYFDALNKLGVKGRLQHFLDIRNSNSSLSDGSISLFNSNIKILEDISSNLNESFSKDASIMAPLLEKYTDHKIIQLLDGKWSLVIDCDVISDIWSKFILPYINSDPKALICIGVGYMVTVLFIKKSVSKINSKILGRIRMDSLNNLSKPPTSKEIDQHIRLCVLRESW